VPAIVSQSLFTTTTTTAARGRLKSGFVCFRYIDHKRNSDSKEKKYLSCRDSNAMTTLTHTGLPDGVFENQKYQIWFIWEGVVTENVGLFYGHLAHFKAIWNIVCMAVWYFCTYLVCFFSISACCTKKNLATLALIP
jgi:hypothetical protein